MLTHTFIHIQSIGIKTEQKLWDVGIRDWDIFSEDLPIPIPAGRKYFLKKGNEYVRTGDQKTLETLLSYNVQDTITLENLMVIAYNMKLKETPFYDTHLIEDRKLPVNPYRADLATVDRIKRSPQYWQSQQWY